MPRSTKTCAVKDEKKMTASEGSSEEEEEIVIPEKKSQTSRKNSQVSEKGTSKLSSQVVAPVELQNELADLHDDDDESSEEEADPKVNLSPGNTSTYNASLRFSSTKKLEPHRQPFKIKVSSSSWTQLWHRKT